MHSWWLLLPLVGWSCLGGAGFLYVGLRARRKAWWIAGLVYLAAGIAPLALTDTSNKETTAADSWAVGLLLAGWAASVIHGLLINSQWLQWQANRVPWYQTLPAVVPIPVQPWQQTPAAGITLLTGTVLPPQHYYGPGPGFGIEPDPRTGRAEVNEVAVLFRAEDEAAPAASSAYTAAATLLRLAVTVSAADGDISADEQQHLIAHLRTGLHLTRAEQVRLEAHLQWLIATGTRLAGIKDRLARLTRDQSEKIGRFLVTVAAADGVISPQEVVTLQKIYGLLGLPPALLADELGQVTDAASAPAATHPVAPPASAVRRPAATPTVDASDAEPTATAGSSARPVAKVEPTAGRTHHAGHGLDAEVLATKLHETASVAALLTGIFAEQDAAPAAAARPAAPAPAAPQDTALPLAGLDAAHAALLAELLTRPVWARVEFNELAARHGLMPDGAIEVLNEAAYEAVDDALLDGDDDIVINEYVVKEAAR
jgi:tellurite resistance protein